MTAAVKAASHFGTAQGDHSGQSIARVRWDPSPPQVHTQHVHDQRGLRRFSNEVWVHWFSSPPFRFPFSSFPPSHTFVFLFSFMSSCLHVSFLSFAHTSVLALVCTCTFTYFKHRFQVAQVLTMRWGSSAVPVHLFSISLQPHTPLSRLVLLFMSSSFRLCCAHTYTTVLTLILSAPLGRACVCVCVTFGVTRFLLECSMFFWCRF